MRNKDQDSVGLDDAIADQIDTLIKSFEAWLSEQGF